MIEKIAERTYLLSPPLPGLDTVFSVYLLGEGVLIEPGPTTAVPAIMEGMRWLGIQDLSYIIPTHIHIDHAGGAGRLAQLFPRAKVALHPQGVKHSVDPSRLIESTKLAFGNDFEALYGPILPVPQSQVLTPADGEVLSANGRELQVVYAPGHAPHHMALYDRKTGGLFCGEALGAPRQGSSTPLPSVAPPSFDMEVYLATMSRLRALKPKLLFYSHDGVGREPERLITLVEENTRIFGDIVLKAMKAGESAPAIESRVRQYASEHLHLDAEALGVKMTVAGYWMYFKKKGLA